MRQKKQKYLLSLLVMGSIMLLSFRDTLSFVHTLLHGIPNSFHHHKELAFYHQHTTSKRSFFQHGHNHAHSLDDHVHTSPSDKQATPLKKDKSEKSETEKSFKTKLFYYRMKWIQPYFLPLVHQRIPFYFHFFIDSLYPSPPSPPPEAIA